MESKVEDWQCMVCYGVEYKKVPSYNLLKHVTGFHCTQCTVRFSDPNQFNYKTCDLGDCRPKAK
jgi:hypothetical protein